MTSTVDKQELKNPDFLVFSDDWGEHPSSCQHIFKHIAKDHRVLWVNTIGMRNPTLSWTDARKAFLKVSKMFGKKLEPVPAGGNQNITVCQPFMLPGNRSRAVRAFNAQSVTRKVSAIMSSLGMRDPICVTTVPNASEYTRLLNGRKVIYYCVDDFSLWPGLDAELVGEMESRLMARADRLVAVSSALFERIRTSGKPAYLLTHGVDIKLFSKPAAREHPVFIEIPKPRVGFFGLIDGRMDWDVVIPLARRMPDVAFVFAGPVDASAGELPSLKNLHFVGILSYYSLPEFIRGVSALILPYKVNSLSNALSPLKLKEYIATGKPVICATIEAAKEWSGAIAEPRALAEWETALRGSLNVDAIASVNKAVSRLDGESWECKAQEFLEFCRPMEPIAQS